MPNLANPLAKSRSRSVRIRVSFPPVSSMFVPAAIAAVRIY